MLLRFWFQWQFKLIRLFGRRGNQFGMDAVCEAFSKTNNEFCAYDLRPKYAEDFVNIPIDNEKLPLYAVVIQGPICKEEQFTLETIKFYRKIFRYGIIIVSTWENEDKKILKKMESEGAVIVTSKAPSVTGIQNVNFQFVSSYAGIEKANQMGCKYVLKTRSDQRIYRNNSFEMLYSLVKSFPCTKNIQKERIICFGDRASSLLWSMDCSDFILFGHIQDMLDFYNVPLDTRFKTRDEVFGKDWGGAELTRKLIAKRELRAENFIVSRYLKHKGYNLDYSIHEYWEIIQDLFICISELDLNLYWCKYSFRYRNHLRSGHTITDNKYRASTYNIDFFNWLSIMTGTIRCSDELEQYQNRKCNNKGFIE